MCNFILLALSITCMYSGIGFRKVGMSISRVALVPSGIFQETPEEILEIGQWYTSFGNIILILGIAGLVYTLYRVFFKKEA